MKFYQLDIFFQKSKEYQNNKQFQINYRDFIINLTEEELKPFDHMYYFQRNILDIRTREEDIEVYNFLKTKHIFIFKESHEGRSFGLNCFELDENDLMYLKLLK